MKPIEDTGVAVCAAPSGTGVPRGVVTLAAMQDARILIVDDEFANVRVLERLLTQAKLPNFRSTTDARQAIPLLEEFAPDIVLLDLHMPHRDGFSILQDIRRLIAAETFLPVLVLTSDATAATRLRALDRGATDFLTKPLDHAEVLLRIRNLLLTRQLHLELAAQNAALEEAVRDRTADLRHALSEVQAMQGQLVQKERLSAFGTMASGVAHDFNNALSMILGYSELLLADDERLSREERLHFVRTVITAAKDSARMVSRLREFYRPAGEPEAWEHVDLSQLARQAVSLTEPKWKGEAARRGAPITVAFEVEPVPPVCGNAAELREMLTNLVFNAVDAMPEGGAITLRVRAEGAEVVVEVADSGTGMTEEVRQRCLEPFFTTKGNAGTGLGLAMVYGICQRHEATMEIESELGRGATFRFRFAAEAPGSAADPAAPLELAHPLDILVVDDQPFICEILEQYLAQDCHRAESVTCAQNALALLREREFDLMITDQAMPDLSGGQLAAAAKELDPSLRVILLTGFGADERPVEGERAIDLVVGKPLSLETLRYSLVEVFSHGSPAPAPSA